MGEKDPTDLEAVVTTRAKVERALSGYADLSGPDQGEQDAQVVVAVARGSFSGDSLRRPQNGTIPAGPAISLVITSDDVVVDRGIEKTYPDLAQLGVPVLIE